MPQSTIYIYGVNKIHFMINVCILTFVVTMQFRQLFILDDIQKSVFNFRERNFLNVDSDIYVDISYEDCRCNIVSIESCLTHLQYKYTYILPIILFLLEVYIIKDILSLDYYQIYTIMNIYWICSIFILFYLFRIVYLSSYHYILTAIILSSLGVILFSCCATWKLTFN